jgi:molecular chaperone GrpE
MSAEVTEQLKALKESLEEVRKVLTDRGEAEATQQKSFDLLYEEMRQYKEDFIFQAEKSLLLDLLLFYDSLNWFRESLVKQQMSPEVIVDSFQYLMDEFLEVLYRRDVMPMEGSERFDRRTQKAIKTIPTTSEEQHQVVAQVLKRGFMRGDRILRSEEVFIYRLADPSRVEKDPGEQ